MNELPIVLVSGSEYTRDTAGVEVQYQPVEGAPMRGGVHPHVKIVGSEATGFATGVTREQLGNIQGNY